MSSSQSRRLNTRQRRQRIRQLLAEHDVLTTREIADMLGLNVNGVSQTLGAMKDVQAIDGQGADIRWGLAGSVATIQTQLQLVDDRVEEFLRRSTPKPEDYDRRVTI